MMKLIPEEKGFAQQFLIQPVSAAALEAAAANSSEYVVADLAIQLYAGTRCVSVEHESGLQLGLLIGDPIDYQSGMTLRQPLVVQCDLAMAMDDTIDAIEEQVFSLGGKWVLVLAVAHLRRVYVDADACLPVVYDSQSGRVASSTGLLLNDQSYREEFRKELYRTLDLETIGWFPSGLTAHHGISRLLCNHYLDLATMQPQRHWPKADFQWANDPVDHAVRIAELTKRQVSAAISAGRVVCSLTAGNESRFLLATLRDFVDSVDFVTVDSPGANLDTVMAEKIAHRFNLRHRVVPAKEATDEQQIAWQYATGHCVGGHNRRFHPSTAELSTYDYFVTGLGGEVGRAFFWGPGDHSEMLLTASGVAARFGLPRSEEVLAATEQWLRTVTPFNALTQLDLAYLELRMSPWAFAQACPQDAYVKQLNPMICRETYQLMLELPPQTKRDSAFLRDAIRQLWPELLDFPINRYGDYRDILALVSKLASPTRLVRAVRKRMGAP